LAKSLAKKIQRDIIYGRVYLSDFFLAGRKKRDSIDGLRKAKKICIIMTSGIGNMVLFVPTLRLLRRNFPDAHLSLLVEPRGTKEIIEESPYVDEILVKKITNRSDRERLAKKLREQNYDIMIVSFTSQNFDNAHLAYLSKAQARIGYDSERCGIFYTTKIKSRENEHEVERNLDILRAIGLDVPEEDKCLELWLSEQDRKTAERFLNDHHIGPGDILVGFHPGSHQDAVYRRWPAQKFAELADVLIEAYGAKIILFGGSGEAGLAGEISGKTKHVLCSAMGKMSITESAALISRCNLFVTNDSGLMHIAAAVRTPLISLWGPSNPVKSAPYGDSEKCLMVSKNLPCQPCYQMYQPFTCSTLDCLKLIAVEEVADLAGQFLGGVK
jgi:heptosyltransferase-2